MEWLEAKLQDHKIRKIVPDRPTLEIAYRRAVTIDRLNSAMEDALIRIEEETVDVRIPAHLADRILATLKKEPELPWDAALETLVGGETAV